jgi:DNA ligase-4
LANLKHHPLYALEPLDGEICAWNHQLGVFSQQSQFHGIRGLRPGNPVYQQCLVIYDICYLNGRVLTNLPLRERIPLYENILRPVRGRVEFSHRQAAVSKAEVVAALNAAIDRREEGVVLKDPDSVYKPNARAGGGWVKLKPEYENELIDQLDLVVLGGYYGSGGGGGTVTQFLMGLRDAATAATAVPRFLAICRVGTGYSGKGTLRSIRSLSTHITKRPLETAQFRPGYEQRVFFLQKIIFLLEH